MTQILVNNNKQNIFCQLLAIDAVLNILQNQKLCYMFKNA